MAKKPSNQYNLHPEAARNLRRNYVMNCLDGGFYMGGIAFVGVETILPTMIEELGGPTWLISFLPQSKILGFMLLPLLTAHLIERLPRVHPFITWIGIFQRMPYLLAAFTFFYLADDHPLLAIMIGASAPLMTSIFGGLTMPAWTQMISRIIPARRRASSNAIRSFIGAGVGVGAGFAAERILTAHPGTFGFGTLYFIGFLILMSSWVFFALIKEPSDRVNLQIPKRRLRDNLRSIPTIFRNDRRFCYFLLQQSMATSYFVATPFLAIHARTVLDRGPEFGGILTGWFMAGLLTGNFGAGLLGDWRGGKVPLLIARTLVLALLTIAMFTTTAAGFYGVFFLWGFTQACNMVGQQTLSIEICPLDRLPTYQAILATFSAPALIVAGFIAWGSRELSPHSLMIPALAAGIGTFISLIALIKVKDPRRSAAA